LRLHRTIACRVTRATGLLLAILASGEACAQASGPYFGITAGGSSAWGNQAGFGPPGGLGGPGRLGVAPPSADGDVRGSSGTLSSSDPAIGTRRDTVTNSLIGNQPVPNPDKPKKARKDAAAAKSTGPAAATRARMPPVKE
jgi:hypothetical protein